MCWNGQERTSGKWGDWQVNVLCIGKPSRRQLPEKDKQIHLSIHPSIQCLHDPITGFVPLVSALSTPPSHTPFYPGETQFDDKVLVRSAQLWCWHTNRKPAVNTRLPEWIAIFLYALDPQQNNISFGLKQKQYIIWIDDGILKRWACMNSWNKISTPTSNENSVGHQTVHMIFFTCRSEYK